MLRSVGVCGNIGNIYVYGSGVGQSDFGLLRLVLQSLHSKLIVYKVDTVGLFELLAQEVDNPLVKVIAAEMVVARGRKNLLNAVADIDDRNVERTASKIVYNNVLILFLINTVSERCRRRLVDDTVYVKSCNLSRVLGSLTL